MATTEPTTVEIIVWWIPQVPSNKPFEVAVPTLDEAVRLIDVLAKYDLYQLENRIKPDFSNAGGVKYRFLKADTPPTDDDWEYVDENDEEDVEYARQQIAEALAYRRASDEPTESYTLEFTGKPGWRSSLTWATEAEAAAEANRRNGETKVETSGETYIVVQASTNTTTKETS